MRGLLKSVVKAIVGTLLLLTPATVFGQALTLTAHWDPNPPADQITGYEVCLGSSSLTCNVEQATVAGSQTSFTFTPSPGALYYFAVKALSGTTESSYSEEVTASIPDIAALSNQNSTINVAAAAVTPSVNDPDHSPLRFSATGLPLGLTIDPATGRMSGTPTASGTYNVTISLYDGLVTVFESLVWTVGDVAPPMLSITSHTSGQTVTSANVTIGGTATDSANGGSGITSVTVNGTAAAGGAATGNGSATWSRGLTLVAGANVITVRATDGASNVKQTQITLNLGASADKTAPALSVTSHQSGATVSTSSVTVSGSATDSGAGGSGIVSVTVNGQPATGGTASAGNAAGWTRSISLNSGSNTMTIVATDGAGNGRTMPFVLTYTPPAAPAAPAAPVGPMTSVSLTMSLASPQPLGSQIAVTAAGGGGSGPYQYRFYVQPQSTTWQIVQDWSTASTYRWTPTRVGAHQVSVWARRVGSTAQYEVYAERSFMVSAVSAPVSTPAPVSPVFKGVSLTASAPSPQAFGRSVIFTATGVGAQETYEYRFWDQPESGPLLMARDYSTSPTFTWTPTVAGRHGIAVWARRVGSSAPYEVYAQAPFVIGSVAAPPPASPVAAGPMTAVSLSANLTSPQRFGATVVLSAAGTGGNGPYEYRFWVQHESGSLLMARDYSTSPTFTWTPTVTGRHGIAVWARRVGSSASYEVYAQTPFVIGSVAAPPPASPVAAGPMTAVSLSANLTSPQRFGATVVLSAAGTGGNGPYEYRFWVQHESGSLLMARDYSTSPTFTWTPTVAGRHGIAVWARRVGSSASYEVYAQTPFVIGSVAAPPPAPPVVAGPTTAVLLSANLTSPQRFGGTVVLSAAVTGGNGPYEYRFWVQHSSGSWQVVQDYSPLSSYLWTSDRPGRFQVAVWARRIGATSQWEVYAERPFVINP